MASGVTQNVGARVWWGPALVTTGALCMHALPGHDLDMDSWWVTWHMDKVLHFLAFSTWGLAMSVALAKQRLFQKGSRFELVMMVGAAIFGTVLECLQGACVPNRSADLADVAADVAGVALALLAFRVIFGCRPGRIATD
ncbi:MAG: hypothetical protein CL835_05490 [Crocinitomicaceae bacterium]|nr:hypothetical protein [Crocinitomicaceae bacterium]